MYVFTIKNQITPIYTKQSQNPLSSINPLSFNPFIEYIHTWKKMCLRCYWSVAQSCRTLWGEDLDSHLWWGDEMWLLRIVEECQSQQGTKPWCGPQCARSWRMKPVRAGHVPFHSTYMTCPGWANPQRQKRSKWLPG